MLNAQCQSVLHNFILKFWKKIKFQLEQAWASWWNVLKFNWESKGKKQWIEIAILNQVAHV